LVSLNTALHFGHELSDGVFCQSENASSDHDQSRRKQLSNFNRPLTITSPSFRIADIIRIELQYLSVVPVATSVGLIVYVEAELIGLRIYTKVLPVEVLVGAMTMIAAVVGGGSVCGQQRTTSVSA